MEKDDAKIQVQFDAFDYKETIHCNCQKRPSN